MFLRARLKSAYSYAVSAPSMILTGFVDFVSAVTLHCSYNEPGVKNSFVNLRYSEQIKAEPFCKQTYEIWDPKFHHRAFNCDPSVNEEEYANKFLYFAKEKGWEDWKAYASQNWIYYLVVPAGIIMAGFAVYGFFFDDEFIQDEIRVQNRARRQAEQDRQAQVQALQQFELRRLAQVGPKKEMKDAQTQTLHNFFTPASLQEIPPPDYEPPSDEKSVKLS